MNLITWNVQWCRGIDGQVDPARIARVARAVGRLRRAVFAGSRGELPGPAGEPRRGPDGRTVGRPSRLSSDVRCRHRSGRRPSGERRRFGNAIFTRLPVQQVFRHSLPWPADPTRAQHAATGAGGCRGSDRRAPARDLDAPGVLLAGCSAWRRSEALLALHAEACGHARVPRAQAATRRFLRCGWRGPPRRSFAATSTSSRTIPSTRASRRRSRLVCAASLTPGASRIPARRTRPPWACTRRVGRSTAATSCSLLRIWAAGASAGSELHDRCFRSPTSNARAAD